MHGLCAGLAADSGLRRVNKSRVVVAPNCYSTIIHHSTIIHQLHYTITITITTTVNHKAVIVSI